jgi:PAS domain S-box-containing protein
MSGETTAGVVDRQLLEESLEELYDHAPCGYVSTLPDGAIVRVNATLAGWLGHEVEQLVGKRLQDLLPAGYQIFYESHFRPLLDMQGFVRELAFELLCAEGRRIPVLLNATQKRAPDGTPMLVRTTVFDVTQRKSYERELLQAKRRAEAAAAAKADLR